MSITYDYIDDYLYRIAAPRDPLLEKMEEYADSNAVPIIGPLVGRLLYNLAKTSQSRKVLEIGTAIGYSGIWLAGALPWNAKKLQPPLHKQIRLRLLVGLTHLVSS